MAAVAFGVAAAVTIAVLLHWRAWQTLLTIDLAVGILLGLTPNAFADTYTWVWQKNPDCGYLDQRLDNSAHPFMSTNVNVVWIHNGALCSNWSQYQPPNSIWVWQDLYAWVNNQPYYCNAGATHYNKSWSTNTSTGYGWPSKPCNLGNWGAIWYSENSAGGYVNPANDVGHWGSHATNWVDIS